MKIVFFSNFLNHQALVADELHRLTADNYTFVEVMPIPECITKSGVSNYLTKQYLLQAWKSEECIQTARLLAVEAVVALFAGSRFGKKRIILITVLIKVQAMVYTVYTGGMLQYE